jgi:hypothetical protein
MADFAGPDNVPNRASNQTGTLQFMAIHGNRSRVVFVMVTIDDGQTRRQGFGQVDCGDVGKCTRRGLGIKIVCYKGLQESCTINEAIESNEHASYCIIHVVISKKN